MNNQDILNQIEEYARQNNVPVIIREGRILLEQAVARIKPMRILEIGTAIGYSGSIMLLASGAECTIDTIELDSERIKIARANYDKLALTDRVRIYEGDAEIILPQLCSTNKYDFVLLDGPKGQYLRHYEIIKPAMTSGALLFADNVLFRGLVAGDKVPARKFRTIVMNMRKFIATVSCDNDVVAEIINQGDGVAQIVKK